MDDEEDAPLEFVHAARKPQLHETTKRRKHASSPLKTNAASKARDIFAYHRDKLLKIAHDVHTSVYAPLLADVASYIHNLRPTLFLDDDTAQPPFIPAIATILSATCADTDPLFSQLVSREFSSRNILACRLRARTCTDLKHTVRKLIEGFTQEPAGELLSLRTLVTWYDERFAPPSPPAKKKSKKGKIDKPDLPAAEEPLLAVIIEDLEAFAPFVLQELVSIIAGDTLRMLPVVIVFGVSTAVTAIHRLLPQSVTKWLTLKVFYAPTAMAHYSALIERLFLPSSDLGSDAPIFCPRLGPSIFRFLHDRFIFENLDVASFISGIEFALSAHFSPENPLAHLCLPDWEASLFDILQFDEVFTALDKTFTNGDASFGSQERGKIVREATENALKRIEEFHREFRAVLECFKRVTDVVVESAERNGFGKDLVEIYVAWSTDANFVGSEKYAMTMKMLKSASYEEVKTLIDRLLETAVVPAKNTIMHQGKRVAMGELAKFRTAITKARLALVDKFDEGRAAFEASLQKPAAPARPALKARMTREQLQGELLKGVAARSAPAPTYFEHERAIFVDQLDMFFRRQLRTPLSVLPLASAFYVTLDHAGSSSRIRRWMLCAPPRNFVESTLLTCERGAGGLRAREITQPDMARVFQLLQNAFFAKKFVPIRELLVAFEEDLGEDADGKPRFYRAIGELEMMGLVRAYGDEKSGGLLRRMGTAVGGALRESYAAGQQEEEATDADATLSSVESDEF